jgi:exonuclease VII large subunit
VISSKVFNVENAFDKVTLKFEKINNIIEKTQNKLDLLSVKLDIYNPAKISSMGYSKVLQKGKSVSSINKIDYDSAVTISMIDGNIDARLVRGNNDVR